MTNLRAGINLSQKAEVYNVKEVRDWRTLWLFKRKKRTKVFTGYINSYYRDGWTGDILEVVDEKHRKRQSIRYEEIENLKYREVDEPLEANPGVKIKLKATS